MVIPIFALANAGVQLEAAALREALLSPITLGVALGLLLGKPVGIVSFAWLAARFGAAGLPGRVGWRHVVGIGVLASIGFTVALFINTLAFADARPVAQAKIGILGASLVGGVLGYALLRTLDPREGSAS